MKKGKNAAGRFVFRISRLIYHIIAISVIGKLFTSYKACTEAVIGPRDKHIKGTERGRVIRRHKVRRALACAMEQNIFSRARRKVVSALVFCSLRTIGFFFAMLGGMWVALYGASLFVSLGIAVSWNHLVSGAISLSIGILLLFSERSLGAALGRNSLLGFLLFGVLGLHDELIKEARGKGEQHYLFASVLALLTAAIGLLIAPVSILAILAAVVLALVILSVPEAGFLLAILVLPFSKLLVGSDLLTVAFLAFMVFGYLGKLLRGNRSFRLELQDIPVLIIVLLFGLSLRTPATGHVWETVIVQILIAVTYLIAVNILSTPHWIFVSRIVFSASGVLAALVGIGQLVFAMLHTDGATFFDFTKYGSVVTAGFADNTALAYYLVIVFAFVLPTVAFFGKRLRAISVILALVLALGVFLTFVSAAWLALALILVLFLLVYEYRSLPFIVAGGGVLSVTLALLPSKVRGNAFGVFRDLTDPTLSALRKQGGEAVRHMLFGNGEGMFSRTSGLLRFFFGAGYRGLSTLHPYFADLSAPFGYHMYNFWQFILVDYGIVGIVIFALFLLLLWQNCFSVLSISNGHDKPLFAYIGIVLVAATVFVGFFHYVWYDPATVTAFFAATALVATAMRYHRSRAEKFTEYEDFGKPCAEIEYRARSPRAKRS